MGHAPTLPAGQSACRGAPLNVGAPICGARHCGPQGCQLAPTSRDVPADTATAGAGAPLSLGALQVGVTLLHALPGGSVLALCGHSRLRSPPAGCGAGVSLPSRQSAPRYLRARPRPRTPRRSRSCSTSGPAGRRCRPGTGSCACAEGPRTAQPGGTPRGALWEGGRVRAAPPAPELLTLLPRALCPVRSRGLLVVTPGRARAAHGAAAEAAFLLPGTVPVVATGVLLCARLRCLPWPHLWALAGFV